MSDPHDYLSLYLLTILFAVLKYTHVIDWNWWLVCSPLLMVAVFYVIEFFASRR
jgi:hypothetical protein